MIKGNEDKEEWSQDLQTLQQGVPWWHSGKESPCKVGNLCLIPEWGRFPGEGNGYDSLPGEFHGQRNLASYSPWGCKQSDMTEQLTHSSHLFHCFQPVSFCSFLIWERSTEKSGMMPFLTNRLSIKRYILKLIKLFIDNFKKIKKKI